MRSTKRRLIRAPDGTLLPPVIEWIPGDYKNPSEDSTSTFTLPNQLASDWIENIVFAPVNHTGASSDLQYRMWYWINGTQIGIRTYNFNGGSGSYFQHRIMLVLKEPSSIRSGRESVEAA